MGSLGELNVKIGAKVDALLSGLQRAERELQKTGRKFDAIGNSISTSLSLPLAGFAAVAVKTQAEYGKSMNQIRVLTQSGTEGMKALEATAQQMGANGTHSVTEISGAMLDLVKAGITPAQIQAGALGGALTLASAGSIGLSDAANIAANSMAQFGLQASAMPAIADAFAGAANASTADVGTLAEALKQVGPMAGIANMSLHETLGTLALFDQNALKGSDAGTSLKTMLMRLVPSTKEAADAMKRYGLDFTDAQGKIIPFTQVAEQLKQKLGGLTKEQQMSALQTMFGSDAIRGATIAMNAGSAGLQKYIDETQKAGSAQELAKANTEGSAGALLKLQNAGVSLTQNFGAALEPAVTALAGAVSKLSGWFTGLDEGTKKIISGMALMVIAIGPALKIYGALANNLSLVVSGFKMATGMISGFGGMVFKLAPRIASAFTIATGPVGLIVAAVVALGGIAAYVYKNWDAFKAKFTNMWITIKAVALGSINMMIDGLNRLLPENMQISRFQISADKFVDQPSFQSFGEFIGSVGNDINGLMSKVTGASNTAAVATKKLNKELEGTAAAVDMAGLDLGGLVPASDSPSPSGGGAKSGKSSTKATDTEPTKTMTDVLNELSESMKKADTMAAAFGTTQTANADKARVVKAAYEELLSMGINPQDAQMQHLVTVYDNLNTQLEALPDALNKAREAHAALNNELEARTVPIGQQVVATVEGIRKPNELLTSAIQGTTDAMTQYAEQGGKSLKELVNVALAAAAKAVRAALEGIRKPNELLTSAIQGTTDAMTQYAEQGGKSLKELGNVALAAAAKAVRAALMQATATQIAKALTTVPFPFNMAVAGAAAAAVGTLFNGAMSKANIPMLATGGLAFGPTMAVVGDNPNARANPEVIAPLDRLMGMMVRAGGGSNVHVTGAISGQDLRLVMDRNGRSHRRQFGG